MTARQSQRSTLSNSTGSGTAGEEWSKAAAMSATLGVVQQTLNNLVKADREGNLVGVGVEPVTSEQMELTRLRVEVARLKMEWVIIKEPQRTSRGRRCEVRVH